MSRAYELKTFRPPVNLKIDYARALNEQQLAAVTSLPGPALVIAGAGSGKTRTLTYRVAYLLEQGIPADRILLLTFTNKAAREMMGRVADLLGGELAHLWGGTFHAIGARILRRHAPRLGYRPDYTILDRDDAETLIKTCVADAGIDPKATRFPKAEALADVFSKAVNTHQSLVEMVEREYRYFAALAPQLEAVQRHYQQRKRAANVMDFDDLLALWLRLLREHPDVCAEYQRQFQFLLVDEYQDTNQLQSDLIDRLAARHQNVMVVGDDSQSIYAWRGANFKNIFEFPKRYPDARIYKIEVNYRSTPEILAVANAAIAANVRQFHKHLAPARKSGLKPVLVPCGDGHQQAAFVAQRLLELREEGVALDQMAVLYRSHFHALELQLELTRRNIPFSITSGIRFFEQAHIKDVAAHLKLVNNPTDELSFKRLVLMLPGIGGKGAAKLWATYAASAGSLLGSPSPASLGSPPGEPVPGDASGQPGRGEDDLAAPGEPLAPATAVPVQDGPTELAALPPGGKNQKSKIKNILSPALAGCAGAAPAKATAAWDQLTATLAQLEAEPTCRQPARMIELVLEAGYDEYLQETYDNYRNRLEDLEQLAAFAQQFKSTDEFLIQLSLLTNLEAEDDRVAARDEERLRLSTIHQAKGLEFDVVFVIMLCDGLFPSVRALEGAEGEEEERRLFYVAITRARNELYLSYPLLRLVGGFSDGALQQSSRFLKELPRTLLDEWRLQPIETYPEGV